MNDSCESPSSSSSSSCPPLMTPTDSGPDGGGMFDMDSSDMDMSNQPNFDPRRHSFSEEELKPQPMIKKARKILVPDGMKVRLNSMLQIQVSGGQFCTLRGGTHHKLNHSKKKATIIIINFLYSTFHTRN